MSAQNENIEYEIGGLMSAQNKKIEYEISGFISARNKIQNMKRADIKPAPT